MSYCRWSTDDFQCDLYVYESAQGIEIHVAGRRRDWKKAGMVVPDPVWLPGANVTDETERDACIAEWMVRNERMRRLLDDPRWEDDDFEGWFYLPEKWAGYSTTLGDYREAADLIEEMKRDGCNVPQYVIDTLREESEEAT